jgi:hypothetical protein
LHPKIDHHLKLSRVLTMWKNGGISAKGNLHS